MTGCRTAFALLLLALVLGTVPAAADGPGPSGADAAGSEAGRRDWPGPITHSGPRPPRRVTGGPGYAGTPYGLGKPAFSGIGPRPDWGRSSID